MSFQAKDILHKGLLRFWNSNGTDTSGISASWAKTLRLLMVHLATARSLSDIQGGIGVQKNAKRLTGHAYRYSIEVNANWRITFDCAAPDTGVVSNIDLEDLHRRGGAKRR
jgi:plasmid maintenance system killer protein